MFAASAPTSAEVHGAPVAAGFGTSAPRLRSTANAGAANAGGEERAQARGAQAAVQAANGGRHAAARSAARRAMNVATSLGSVPRPKPAS